jgi:protein-tyrosine-phosphatase/DNA-binding transcriptional ArsR family regulator
VADAYPGFLELAGHPLRWRLLAALARGDLRVHELTAHVGQSQNLVSYHLAKLRGGALVSARRSSADSRDTYYRLDLARCGQLLADAGAGLHPGLRLRPPAPATGPGRGRRARVLFVCTGNSARSQQAEAFLRDLAARRVEAYSAGSHPKPLHPDAVAVMAEYGLDISGYRSKHLDEFAGRRFSHVVTLCDKVREICPEFPGAGERLHWSVPDPAREPDGFPAFQRAAADLHGRVGFLLHRISTDPISTDPAQEAP